MSEARRQRGGRARRLGRWAETLCVWTLRLRGWRVLARGFTVGRGTGAGEVDIVARRGPVLAFIEVKARPSAEEAAAALSDRQRRRIARAAAEYLRRHPPGDGVSARFDVMTVAPWRPPRHLQDAWREGG